MDLVICKWLRVSWSWSMSVLTAGTDWRPVGFVTGSDLRADWLLDVRKWSCLDGVAGGEKETFEGISETRPLWYCCWTGGGTKTEVCSRGLKSTIFSLDDG